MAFEVPLESDRVDDHDFFSTLVRAPVIGTLQWILGGREKDADDPEAAETEALEEATSENLHSTAYNHPTMKRSKRAGGLKKAAPSLIGSDISDVGEVRESMDAMCLEHEPSTRYIVPGSLKNKKSLSWSDESGKDLVENKVSYLCVSLLCSMFRLILFGIVGAKRPPWAPSQVPGSRSSPSCDEADSAKKASATELVLMALTRLVWPSGRCVCIVDK